VVEDKKANLRYRIYALEGQSMAKDFTRLSHPKTKN